MSTGEGLVPSAPASDEVRLARAYLSRVAEAPAPAVAALVEEVGPVEAAARVRQGPAGGLRADVLGAVVARHEEDRAEADLEALAARGGRLVVPEDPEWPVRAFAGFVPARALDRAGQARARAAKGLGGAGQDHDEAADRGGWSPDEAARDAGGLVAPLALWVHGPLSLDDIGMRSVAVVGSRAASDYGNWVARDWGAGLAERGVPVVSGAALGIDAAAHRGALAADGTTVAVLACGTDRAYPSTHVRLLEHVAAHGAVLSEYPPGGRPWRQRFLVRNRLIAALAGGTLLVEAGARSGARSTASAARRLDKWLMAVPGPVTSPMSVGCHRLIREHEALLVSSVDEVVEHVGRMGDDLAPRPCSPSRPTDGLSPGARAAYDALPVRAARSESRLAHDSGVDPAEIATHLSDLEGRGLAEGGGGLWRRRPG